MTDECEIASILVRLLYSSSIFHGLAARSESMQRSITRVARESKVIAAYGRVISNVSLNGNSGIKGSYRAASFIKKKWNDLAVSDEDSTRLREREREERC